MKIAVLILFMSISAMAQDSVLYKTVTITNWVKAGPFLRVVNGKTYNIAYSYLWGEPLAGLHSLADNGHPIRYDVIPMSIKDGKTYCDIYGTTYWYETWTGQQQDEEREFYKTVAIYNAPTNVILDKPFKFKCIKVDDLIQSNRFICEAYDCGLPDTNLVPIVQTIRVKAK